MSDLTNPYKNVNWNNVKHINSSSHAHILTTDQFIKAYNDGLDHFNICDYDVIKYPAVDFFPDLPTNVISSIVESPGNEIRPSGVPHDFIHIPNVGSLYTTEKSLQKESWESVVRNLYKNKLTDYLHILIAHPTRMPVEAGEIDINTIIPFLKRFYKYRQPYTKGIEIYNHSSDYSSRIGAWSVDLWDELLKENYHFYCHMNPDHEVGQSRKWRGYNRLLIDGDITKEKAIKAYQEGNFYCSLLDTDLKFLEISEIDKVVKVKINKHATIKFITNNGIEKTVDGISATFDGANSDYVRIEVEKEIADRESYMGNYNEMLFSQALMNDRDDMRDISKRILLLES